MGKGDKKTRKGKIFMGSYGITRRRKKKKSIVIISKKKAVTAESTAPEKATAVEKDVSATLNITKKTPPKKIQAKSELRQPTSSAEGDSVVRRPKEATSAEGGTKKTASKKTSTTKKATVKKAATKKTSAKK